MHAQDAHKLYIHDTEKRSVAIVVGVVVVVVVVVEDSSVSKEAERRCRNAQ